MLTVPYIYLLHNYQHLIRFVTENLRISTILKVKSTQAAGTTYLEIVNVTTNHSYDGRVRYNLTNLFKGSPETSKSKFFFP